VTAHKFAAPRRGGEGAATRSGEGRGYDRRVKVLVTGASGFLGHAVCAELLERGHEVGALVRRPGSEPAGTAALAGDLSDTEALKRGLDAVAPEVVIHLAAEIATQRDPLKIAEVNIVGTRRLLEACEAANGPRFVFTSTVVTGDAGGDLLDEQSTLPIETAYGRSKQEGERLVRASGLHDVIIRPSHVYGAGGWYVEEIVKRLRAPGRLAVVGSGENWWDVVRVEDVASACGDAAERAPSGALYHVVDDEPIRYYDFAAVTAKALGVGAPRRIPAWLARLVAGADPVRAVIRSARSANAHIKAELGWQPRYPTAREGVPDAIARLR
jgi:nucleoside-diphosphate-sugar epimerase